MTPSGENAYGNQNPNTGPWPECVGWEGTDCKKYLETITDDDPSIYIVYLDPQTIFNYHRVKVFTNDQNIVYAIPHRG